MYTDVCTMKLVGRLINYNVVDISHDESRLRLLIIMQTMNINKVSLSPPFSPLYIKHTARKRVCTSLKAEKLHYNSVLIY